jgi:hypothetical protein
MSDMSELKFLKGKECRWWVQIGGEGKKKLETKEPIVMGVHLYTV